MGTKLEPGMVSKTVFLLGAIEEANRRFRKNRDDRSFRKARGKRELDYKKFEGINRNFLSPLLIHFFWQGIEETFPRKNSERAECSFPNYLTIQILINLYAVTMTVGRTSYDYQHFMHVDNHSNAHICPCVGGLNVLMEKQRTTSNKQIGATCKGTPIRKNFFMTTLGEFMPTLRDITSTTRQDLVQKTVPSPTSESGPTL